MTEVLTPEEVAALKKQHKAIAAKLHEEARYFEYLAMLQRNRAFGFENFANTVSESPSIQAYFTQEARKRLRDGVTHVPLEVVQRPAIKFTGE